jgi:hypothetical protein
MAEEKTAVAEQSFGDGSPDLEQLTPAQWDEWEKTGEMPGTKKEEKPAEESPAPKEEKAAEPDAKASESSTETHRQERKPTEAEKRIKELLGQVKELTDENSKLKAPPKDTKETKKEESSRKPTMQDKNADGTPKYPATDEGFEKYTDDMLDWKQQERDAKSKAEQIETEKKTREAKIAEVRKKQEESWTARAEESRKKHDDFDAVALAKDLPLVENSIPDQWLLRSPQGAEMLYFFGQNHAELKRINDLAPDDQLRELVKLEDKLAEPAPNKVTRASKPPSEVGARKSATSDAVKAAVDNDDYESYAAEQNRREVAQMGTRKK